LKTALIVVEFPFVVDEKRLFSDGFASNVLHPGLSRKKMSEFEAARNY